jgi:hypothetical protein
MLENTFLESLTITEDSGSIYPVESSGGCIKVKEFLALISELQLNRTLKTLGFQASCSANLNFTVDEVNQLVWILMQNFGLERLVPDIPYADDETVKATLRLKRAGCRYLTKDGSAAISKGVDILNAVSDEVDCVFLHMLENLSMCDRRAAEATTGRRIF